MVPHPRTELSSLIADSRVHDAVLSACARFPQHIAIIDTSLPKSDPRHRISYADYGELLRTLASGFLRSGLRPGEIIAIFLANSWEFAASYHAATLAGLVPTPLNPHYREREVRYQLEDSHAAAFISDAHLIANIDLGDLPNLRAVYTTRIHAAGAGDFTSLLVPSSAPLPQYETELAALPYSSGTTGLPKGVMLTHDNLVINCRQLLAPGEIATYVNDEINLCFLPLYHIYGLNVVLNPTLMTGGTVVLMPRFDLAQTARLVLEENITWLNVVPPVMNAICAAAEQNTFPRAGQHRIRGTKCGAAPLAADLPRRFTELTGIRVRQGYGMTEASPVTHLGYLEPALYSPDSIGAAVAHTDCRILREDGSDCDENEPGELVMRGPQFMRGYWNAPEATDAVLRDGWYFSGDVATADHRGFFRIVDRRKELIKYKGFSIAPAEVEAVLLEHSAVRDCGVVARSNGSGEEVPVAFIVLEATHADRESTLRDTLPAFVAERLVGYKQPREVRFVTAIPRNPSGKILRKDLRAQL